VPRRQYKSERRKHVCNVCQSCGEWGSGWQSYGSALIEDEGLPVLKTCSEKCRAKIDDPAGWLLRLWIKMNIRPSTKVLKTFRRFPKEIQELGARGRV
jgi:hypothetical protein